MRKNHLLWIAVAFLSFMVISCNDKTPRDEPVRPPELRYIEFVPDIIAGPTSLSDNGQWVVGCSLYESYIFNIVNEEIIYIKDIDLNDISDDGKVAYGQARGVQGAKYENGSITILDDGTGKTGGIYSTTPDGSKAVGIIGANPSLPVLYDNTTGTFTYLSMEGEGLTGCYGTGVIERGSTRHISADGNIISGSVIDDLYSTGLGCYWNADGSIHRIDNSASAFVESIGWFDIIYHGGILSHDGRYYVGSIERNTGPFDGNSFPFMLDTSTGDMRSFDAPDFPEYTSLGASVVTNDGDMIFSKENIPYIYTKNGDLLPYQQYLEEKYDMSIEPQMQGIIVSVSEDGRTILMGESLLDELGFITKIYTF